jgi:hypothetical protein
MTLKNLVPQDLVPAIFCYQFLMKDETFFYMKNLTYITASQVTLTFPERPCHHFLNKGTRADGHDSYCMPPQFFFPEHKSYPCNLHRIYLYVPARPQRCIVIIVSWKIANLSSVKVIASMAAWMFDDFLISKYWRVETLTSRHFASCVENYKKSKAIRLSSLLFPLRQTFHFYSSFYSGELNTSFSK